jgi:hypothetical protein
MQADGALGRLRRLEIIATVAELPTRRPSAAGSVSEPTPRTYPLRTMPNWIISEWLTIRPEQLREHIRKDTELIRRRDMRASSRGDRATVDNVISAADKRASV